MARATIRVLACGETTLDYDLAVTVGVDEVLTADKQSGGRRLLTHPIYAYVIDHPDGRVLVDTGVSETFEKQWKNPFYRSAMSYDDGGGGHNFVRRLEGLGLGPDDFDYVVLTHLHTDHAGNAPLFDRTDAKLLVHEDELRGAVTMKGGLLRDDDLTVWGVTSPQGFVRSDFGFLVPDRATTFFGDIEILRDVWVVSIPGHTWGTVGVAVRLEHQGWVFLASDAIYVSETFQQPLQGSILNQNQELWARSAVKIRRLAEKYDMQVFPGHDAKCIVGMHNSRPLTAPVDERYT
jgi:glyoxylase-like metal-dependent hydrolase (beta-lactamase superfamily II)